MSIDRQYVTESVHDERYGRDVTRRREFIRPTADTYEARRDPAYLRGGTKTVPFLPPSLQPATPAKQSARKRLGPVAAGGGLWWRLKMESLGRGKPSKRGAKALDRRERRSRRFRAVAEMLPGCLVAESA